LSELSKYDILLDEIVSLEQQITRFNHGYILTSASCKDLELANEVLRMENTSLQKKNEELEAKMYELIRQNEKLIEEGKLNLEERESLKQQILDSLRKIDFHLSS
jgi:hypothetical protein